MPMRVCILHVCIQSQARHALAQDHTESMMATLYKHVHTIPVSHFHSQCVTSFTQLASSDALSC